MSRLRRRVGDGVESADGQRSGAQHGIGGRTARSEYQLVRLLKAEELKKRIWFTLGALVVFRLGTYIPLPGIDPAAFEAAFNGQKQGVLDMFNMFSGGAVQRMAVFALNIMPYISASIIIQLLSSVIPQFEAIKKEGERAARFSINTRAISPWCWRSSRPTASRSVWRDGRESSAIRDCCSGSRPF